MDSEPTERDRWRANERTGGDMSDAATLNRLFAGIEADLVLVDRAFQERTASDLFLLNSAVAHVLSSPGKRLRTALTLLSGKLIDYRFDKLLPLSLSLEMVHLATLVHDDIVDKASTRRGIPTVNAEHGDAVAILLGDYLFAKTSGIVAEVEDFRVDRLFAETVARICEGTIIELLSKRGRDPPDDAVDEVVGWLPGGPAFRGAVDLPPPYAGRARARLSEFASSPKRDVLKQQVEFERARGRWPSPKKKSPRMSPHPPAP